MKTILRFVLVASLAVVVAACGPRGNRNERNNVQQNGQPMSQNDAGGHHGGKLRRICADDIQKLCSGQDKFRRCLRDNSDKLEPACKTALDEALERSRERKRDRMNNQTNQTQPNGTQPQNQAAPQNNGQQHNNASNNDGDDD